VIYVIFVASLIVDEEQITVMMRRLSYNYN